MLGPFSISVWGAVGGILVPWGTSQEGGQGRRHQQRGGDTVLAVPGSSESTRSYRRISGMVGKAGSAMSPQSPSGPEDPAQGKVPPVPMPRRFAPVGAMTQGGLRGAAMGGVTLCIPKHSSSHYPGVADGGIGDVTSLHLPCGGVCHPLAHPFAGQGEAEAGEGGG